MSVASIRTLADLFKRLGDVPPDRIRFHPAPGTATLQDVLDIQNREGRLVELVDGVLLEKTVGYRESRLALFLGGILNSFVVSKNLGIVTGSDGTMELMPDLVRIPDAAFVSWSRLPGGREPLAPIPRLAPNLAVEVLSRSNTPGEMVAKRRDYFAGGVELVWEIDPNSRTVTVYTSPTGPRTLSGNDTLDGGPVLPDFTLPLAQLFAELDRHA